MNKTKTNEKDLNMCGNIKTAKRCVNLKKKGVCDFCKGKLIETKDILVSRGKSLPINVRECKECGKTVSSLKELERVRKELHPSLWAKVKNCFHSPEDEIEVFKGKVL